MAGLAILPIQKKTSDASAQQEPEEKRNTFSALRDVLWMGEYGAMDVHERSIIGGECSKHLDNWELVGVNVRLAVECHGLL